VKAEDKLDKIKVLREKQKQVNIILRMDEEIERLLSSKFYLCAEDVADEMGFFVGKVGRKLLIERVEAKMREL